MTCNCLSTKGNTTSSNLNGFRIPLILADRCLSRKSDVFRLCVLFLVSDDIISFRYFFHATAERALTDEYNSGLSDDDEAMDTDKPGQSTSSIDQSNPDSGEVQPKTEEPDEMDPSLAEWLKVDGKTESTEISMKNDSDTETDADSDNADVVVGDETDDLDDWLKVEPKSEAGIENVDHALKVCHSYAQLVALMHFVRKEDADVKMGESEVAMEYDQDLIFKHLCVPHLFNPLLILNSTYRRCFYLDSPDNAHKHGLNVKSKYEKDINQR
jgi:DNA ligase-4